jgi:hypothetical protein
MDKVFRITTYYANRNSNLDKIRWMRKSKDLFDSEKEFNKKLKWLKKMVEKKQGGIMHFKLVCEQFINDTWEILEEVSTLPSPEE